MKRYTLFLALFLQSCITAYTLPDRKNIIPKEIKPHLLKFLEAADRYAPENTKMFIAAKVANLDIGFADLSNIKTDSRVIGLCTLDVYNQPRIVLDYKIWEEANTIAREFIVFHELGHCVLKRTHRSAYLEDMLYAKIKSSIMYPKIFSEEVYEMFRGYYLYELFNHKGIDYGGKCNFLGPLPKN